MPATLVANFSLINPGMADWMKATLAPHRTAVRIRTVPLPANSRSALPSNRNASASSSPRLVPMAAWIGGDAKAPIPISIIGNRVSSDRVP